jgi:hypothetical protein
MAKRTLGRFDDFRIGSSLVPAFRKVVGGIEGFFHGIDFFLTLMHYPGYTRPQVPLNQGNLHHVTVGFGPSVQVFGVLTPVMVKHSDIQVFALQFRHVGPFGKRGHGMIEERYIGVPG